MSDEVFESFAPRSTLGTLMKDYDFFRRSYEGGSAYREGKYLIKHDRESEVNFKRRLDQASYVNFCADVVDINTSYLYKEEPTRDFKTEDSIVEEFLEDSDLDKRPWHKVMREISKMAAYMGAMGVIVDKPPVPVPTSTLSKKAESDLGIKPYVALYSPMAIWDWEFGITRGVRTLTKLVLKEDTDGGPNQVKVWYPDHWELWEAVSSGTKSTQEGSVKYKKVDKGTNTLGVIPFALLRNRDSLKRMTGVSDIADIAGVNRRIYYLDSDALEIIDSAAIPILEGTESALDSTAGEQQEVNIGTKSVLTRPDGEPEGFRWIEAPHTSLAQILKWREQAVADIKYMSKSGQGDPQKQTAESGVALELRFQQLGALLSEKAENAEAFEVRIFELIARWQNLTNFDFEIQYPRKFGIRDLMHDLDVAISAKGLISSRTFAAEISKNMAVRMLPRDTDPKIIAKIEKELDQGPVTPPDDGNNPDVLDNLDNLDDKNKV